MTRRTITLVLLGGLLASGPAGLVACGSSFKAVDAAGKQGAKIGDQVAVLDRWEDSCESFVALSANKDVLRAELAPPDARSARTACTGWKTSIDTIKKIALALAAYAAKLSAVANAKDVNIGAPEFAAVSAIGITGWTKDSTNSKIVTSVVQLFSEEYRKKSLSEIITHMSKPVSDAVQELDMACQVAGEQLQVVKSKVREPRDTIIVGVLRIPDDAGAAPVASPVAGLLLQNVREMTVNIDLEQAQTDSLQTAVDAFGQAHAQLCGHHDDLESDDALAAVFSAIANALSNASAKDGGAGDAQGHD